MKSLNSPHPREPPDGFCCTLIIVFHHRSQRLPAHEGRNHYFPRAWLTSGCCHIILLPRELSYVFAALTSGSFLHSSGIHPFLALPQKPSSLCLCSDVTPTGWDKLRPRAGDGPPAPRGSLALSSLFASRTHILGRAPFPFLYCQGFLVSLPTTPSTYPNHLP